MTERFRQLLDRLQQSDDRTERESLARQLEQEVRQSQGARDFAAGLSYGRETVCEVR